MHCNQLFVMCLTVIVIQTVSMEDQQRQERGIGAIAGIVFQVGGKIISAAGFANKLYSLINGDDSGPEFDKDALVDAVDERVRVAIENLYSKLHLRDQLAEVDEVKYDIWSVLTDLEFYFRSNDNEKVQYLDEFLLQSPEMISNLRSLPERLHQSLAGATNPILGAISTETRCNMTALDTFEQFFWELLKNGILAEMTYKKLKYNVSLELETEYWDTQLVRVHSSFRQQEESCLSQFKTLALEDLTDSHDMETLFTSNSERYRWFHSDVFFLRRADERLYTEGSDENLLHVQNQGTRKYVFFVDKMRSNASIKCITVVSNADLDDPSITISPDSPANPPIVIIDIQNNHLYTVLMYSSDTTCRSSEEVKSPPIAAAPKHLSGNLAWWVTITITMFKLNL
ncbi:uncharacterized protein LOC128220564 [Mya arenaria]|uniref:uncharacterized protein LOC128220564 n=1 Tax=Mya arenaria TaxID=6604 RepID=UPI0022E8D92E|nr:uncharacterized protein LOC128220564 [Mya arenaria]